jgi:hypothetical protein
MQWKSSGSPRPKKGRISKSKLKTVLICLLDSKGMEHREFVQPGQTVSQKIYGQILEHLRQRIRHMRPELLPDK